MKKTILIAALAFSAAYGAPSITGSGVTVAPSGTAAYTFGFVSGGDSVVSFDQKFDFSALPADVTISSVSVADAVIYSCSESAKIVTCAASSTGLTDPIADNASFLTVNIAAASGAVDGSYAVVQDKSYESYQETGSGNDLTPGTSTLNDVVVQAGSGSFAVTATAGANGSLACTPPDGPAGTVVTCTATPNLNFEVDVWSGVCASTTAGATTCNFTLNKDEAVGVSFKVAGSGGGSAYTVAASPIGNGSVTCTPLSGNVPAQISCTATPGKGATQTSWGGNCASATIGQVCTFDAVAGNNVVTAAFNGGNAPVGQPVPAIGLLSLFGMLASLMGAAAMVLRRKV